MMTEAFKFRQAKLEDIPFLVETIIEAEKSGTPVFTYNTIFGLGEEEAGNYIAKMLEEEIDDCELSVSGFLLAEKDGNIVGAVGAWVEGAQGVPSTVLKGNLLAYVLPATCLERANKLSHIARDIHIEYRDHTVQIGLVYVASEARGQGLVTLLIDRSISYLKEEHPELSEAYIQVFGNNIPALKAYEKAGFTTILTKKALLPETANYMPDSSKVLMKKNI